jgi:hypothetical protein
MVAIIRQKQKQKQKKTHSHGTETIAGNQPPKMMLKTNVKGYHQESDH